MAEQPRKTAEIRQPATSRAPTDPSPLLIHVDTQVRIACDTTPRPVVEALRRQLRRHDIDRLVRHAGRGHPEVRLLRSSKHEYRMPQTLLGQLLEACRRNGVTYRVVDERSLAECPRLHSTVALSTAQTAALRQLLLRDCGLLVAQSETDRTALAAELIARRQQKTIVLGRPASTAALCEALSSALALGADDLAQLKEAKQTTRVVVADYDQASQQRSEVLGQRFGLAIFADLVEVDPIALMRALHATGTHYLLGLAREAARPDGLHGPLFFALGGITHQMTSPVQARATKLVFKRQVTHFEFDYQGREQYQTLLARLADDEERNGLIARDLAAEVAAGHPCVVLSERRDHLDQIARQLPSDQAMTSESITSSVRPSERSAIMARFARGELKVLLATGQIASDSLSLQRAHRIFIAFPFSYGRKLERIIEQLMRPSEGKNDVVVYDYDDVKLAPLHRACEKRSKIITRLQRSAERAYADWAQMKLEI